MTTQDVLLGFSLVLSTAALFLAIVGLYPRQRELATITAYEPPDWQPASVLREVNELRAALRQHKRDVVTALSAMRTAYAPQMPDRIYSDDGKVSGTVVEVVNALCVHLDVDLHLRPSLHVLPIDRSGTADCST